MYLHSSGRYHLGVTPHTSSRPKRPVFERLARILAPDPNPRWSLLKCKYNQEALEKIHCCFQICSLNCSSVPQRLGHKPRTREPQKTKTTPFSNTTLENYTQNLLQPKQICSATTTAYLGVGCWVSLPPCFEERSLLRPKEHGVEFHLLNVKFGRGMLFPAWLYIWLDTQIELGKLFLNEVRFPSAGCPEEHGNCSPDTFRAAHQSWKLYSPFLSNLPETQYSSSLTILGTFPLF